MSRFALLPFVFMLLLTNHLKAPRLVEIILQKSKFIQSDFFRFLFKPNPITVLIVFKWHPVFFQWPCAPTVDAL